MTMPYRKDIDGLRAIAVLLVVVFHFELLSFSKAGFIGVDVFFVISGFLITSVIKRQLDTGVFSFTDFYISRVRRLAPALFAVLLLVLLFGVFVLLPRDLEELGRQILTSQFYVANIYFWRTIDYFGLAKDDVFLLHTWSLAAEEQFYLLYPLALFVVYRYLRRFFWPAIMLGLCLSFALNLAMVETHPQATFYLLPTRAWELLAGGLLVPLMGRLRRTRAVDESLAMLGLLLIAAALLLHAEDTQVPGLFALLPVTGSALVIMGAERQTTLCNRLLSTPLLTLIGQISYSLYLVHWPINVYAQRLLGNSYTMEWRVSMMAASFLLAAAIFKFVEQPFRQRKVLAFHRPLLRGYVAGVVATVASFFVLTSSAGLPSRFPDEVTRLAAFADDKSPPLEMCAFHGQTLDRASDFCTIGSPAAKPSWVVFGDSHAWAAHTAFHQWLLAKGESGLFAYLPSCPPILGTDVLGDHGACRSFNSRVFGFLGANPGTDKVLLVSTWIQATEGRLSTSPNEAIGREQSERLFAKSFDKTIRTLNGWGKRIFVWEPVPGAKERVPDALAFDALRGTHHVVEHSLAEYNRTFQFFFDAEDRNRRFIETSFSPSRFLCASGTCAVQLDGVPLYFDTMHVTESSWPFWVEMLRSTEGTTQPTHDSGNLH